MSINKGLANAPIKTPNTSETYTEHELEELAKCMDPDTGILHFAENYAYIQHPVRGKVQFEPYEYQKRMLKAFNDYTNSVYLCPRQSGKCVSADTKIRLRNKHTGEIVQTTVGEFFEQAK